MIMFGVALAPALHPSLLQACTGIYGSIEPAAAIRTFGLLLALARGGLTTRFAVLKRLHVGLLVLSFIPYATELVVEAFVGRAILPEATGLNSGSYTSIFLAASIWAALSPSIVIPNMLDFAEHGMKSSSGFVLAAAPFEMTTAIIVFSALESCAKSTSSAALTEALAFIPVQIIGSVFLGVAMGCIFWLFIKYRSHPVVERFVGAREPIESVVIFFGLYYVTYVICESYYIPILVGLFSARVMGVSVKYMAPDDAPLLTIHFIEIWRFTECFLFVLTGSVVRDAIDSNSPALRVEFFIVLMCGSVGRMAADLIVACVWQKLVTHAEQPFNGRNALRRCVFLWTSTIPKATIQATLGPRVLLEATSLGMSLATGSFIAQSSAMAILYCATAGSLLTHSIGRTIAVYLESQDSDEHDSADNLEEISIQPIS